MKPLLPYLLTLVPSLLGAFAMNAWVDPSALGGSQAMTQIAERQSPSEILVSETTDDQRAWVRAALEHRSECAEVLVIGSSTAGVYSSELLRPRTVLNAWLGGPTIEDFEAVTVMLRHSSCPFPTIMLGVDPWWLGNPEIRDQRWMAVLPEYEEYHQDASFLDRASVRAFVEWARFEDRLGFETTRESLRLLRQDRSTIGQTTGLRLLPMTGEEFCPLATTTTYIRAYDGHYTTCPLWAFSPETIALMADRYLRVNFHSMGEWRELATDRVERLGQIVEEWQSAGHRVWVVAPPYHPVTFERLSGDVRVAQHLADLDAMLEHVNESGATFVNLRDPATVGCTPDEFEDSHHSRRTCAARVVAHLRSLGAF